jgi:hypothetical protein
MCGSQEIEHYLVCQKPVLSEPRIWIGVILMPPAPNASLYCATDTLTYLRMAIGNLLKYGHRTQPRNGPQHRNDLAVPNTCDWVARAGTPIPRYQTRFERFVFAALHGRATLIHGKVRFSSAPANRL